MNRVYRLLALFLFPALFTQAQNPDSLRSVINTASLPDSSRLQALNALTWTYLFNQPDSVPILALQAIELAQKTGNKNQEAKALGNLGVKYMYEGKYPEAIDYYRKAQTLYEKTDNKKGIANCLSNTGLVFDWQQDFPKALEYYLKALAIREQLNDKKGMGDSYNNIGLVYKSMLNPDKALEYFEKSLAIRQQLGDKKGVGNCYGNMGIVYHSKKNYTKALEYYRKDLEACLDFDDRIALANCYNAQATLYQDQKNYGKALENFLLALSNRKIAGDEQGAAMAYANLAELYNLTEDLEKAMQYSDSSLAISKRIGYLEGERFSYRNLSVSCEKKGDFRNAYYYHIHFKNLTDSIFNADNSQRLSDLKTSFEVEKKEAELSLKAEEEGKRHRLVIYSVAGILAVVLIFSFFLFNRFRITSRQKVIIEKQKAQVDKAYEDLHEKNKEVMDSIYYARRIQRSLLSSEKYIHKNLNRLRKP